MDKTIVDILKKMGAAVDIEENSISVNTVQAAPLTHEDVSAAQTPDLVPVLSSVMAASCGNIPYNRRSKTQDKRIRQAQLRMQYSSKHSEQTYQFQARD